MKRNPPAMSPTCPADSVPEGSPAPSAPPRLHLLDTPRSELERWLTAAGWERYRADQILRWVYGRGVTTFEAMTDLGKELRAWLSSRADIYRADLTAESASCDGTRKLLLTWPDSQSVETVWIPDARRHTVCLSSQVGCPVGCSFCASGRGGWQRNLTAGEIVEQALRVRQLVAAGTAGGRLSNIVLMGMGEPLANYDAVVKAVRIINAPWGLGIGARKITLSTVGLPKQIRRLAEEGLQLNLAVSLHAPNERLRRELIPWGRVPLEELLGACAYYFARTVREVTLEYVLLADVNMHPEHADQLAALAGRLRCNVNLLRYNPVPGLPFARPTAEAAHAFQARLRSLGVNAHLRKSRGADIEAACGQLRRRLGQDKPPGGLSSTAGVDGV